MDLHLDGRVAIVTAASRGLGRAIAEALAREGAHVLGTAQSSEGVEAIDSFGSPSIQGVLCDATDRAAVASLPDRTVDRFGRLDIVVNNVGGMRRGLFSEQALDEWEWHLSINVLSAVALTRAAGERFLAQRSGKVINLASTAAVSGGTGIVAYCAAKGAVLQLTKALAVEWAPFGVQVNAIGPGAFDTTMQPSELREAGAALDERLTRIPDGRMGRPEEVAPIACYLASPLADHVTGALYMIDGGETVRL